MRSSLRAWSRSTLEIAPPPISGVVMLRFSGFGLVPAELVVAIPEPIAPCGS